MSTALLDLIGVLLLGLVAALAVTVVQSQPPPGIVITVAEQLGLSSITDQELVVVFAGAAAVVLLAKSIVSSYLTRRVFIFLANRQALVSSRLARALFAQPLIFLQQRSSQETSFALVQGTGAATLRILGQAVVAATETSMMFVLAVALFLIDPLVTLGSVVFFLMVAMILQRVLGGWADRIGAIQARADIASLDTVQELISAYREILVSNRREEYASRVEVLRWQASRVTADFTVIQMLPKYIFEAALVVGGFALAGTLFATQDSVAAVGTLALFLAAATRVMPSLLRLQSAVLTIRGAAGVAALTFRLAEELKQVQGDLVGNDNDTVGQMTNQHRVQRFRASIELNDVTVSYPGMQSPALRKISLQVAEGRFLALVGKSGSGKSTLADVILGVIDPQEGTVKIGGVSPAQAIKRWPGSIAYVPQNVILTNGSVRSNVALGIQDSMVEDDLVWSALDKAHLGDYLREKREGLNTYVGEGGLSLSGGQRQRLGLARALYTQPSLLVLDEATSALDAETEEDITTAIRELEGEVTRVVIAHRLSTLRSADVMIYLEDGKPEAIGTFDQIKEIVPNFARQADLMGI